MMPVSPINDASLWNLSTQNGVKSLFSSNKSPDEYYEFQIIKTLDPDPMANVDIGKIINMNKYKCHICNVEVPKAYSLEHINSEKHKTCKIIADTALERTKEQLNLEPINANVNIHITNSYFCEFCVSVVMNTERNDHEMSSQHLASVEHDKILKEFATKYIGGSISVHDKDGLTIIRDDVTDQATAQSLFNGGFASTRNDVANIDSHVKSKAVIDNVVNDNIINIKVVNDRAIQKAENNDDSETSQKENDSSQCNRIESENVPEQSFLKAKNKKKNKTIQGNLKKKPVKERSLLPNGETVQHMTQPDIKPKTLPNPSNNAKIVQVPPQQPSIEEKPAQNGPQPKIVSKIVKNVLQSPKLTTIDAKTRQCVSKQPNDMPKTAQGVPKYVNIETKTVLDVPKQVDVEKQHELCPKKIEVDTKTMNDVPKQSNVELKTIKNVSELPNDDKTQHDVQNQTKGEIKTVQDIPEKPNVETLTLQEVTKLTITVETKLDQADVETKTVLDEPTEIRVKTKTIEETKIDQVLPIISNVKINTIQNDPKQPTYETLTVQDLLKEVYVKVQTVPDVGKLIVDDGKQSNFETNTVLDVSKQVDLGPKNVLDFSKDVNIETDTVFLKQPNVKTKTVQDVKKEHVAQIKTIKDPKVDTNTMEVPSMTLIVDTKTAKDCPIQPKIEKKAVQNILLQSTSEAKTEQNIPQPNVGDKNIESVRQKSAEKKTANGYTQHSFETKFENEIQQQNMLPKTGKGVLKQENTEKKYAQVPSTSNSFETNNKPQQSSKKTVHFASTSANVKPQSMPQKQVGYTQHSFETKSVKEIQQQNILPKTVKGVSKQENTEKKYAQVPSTSNSVETNNKTQQSSKKTVHFACTTANIKPQTMPQKHVYRNGNKKKRGIRKYTVQEIKNYIQYAKDRCVTEVQFDIEVISDRNLIITAINADTVKISLFHFHGTDKQGVYCKVCQLHNIKDIFHHQQTTTHMDKIMKPLENKHCIRKLDDIWSHCIICNMTYISRHNESHVLSLAHIHNLRSSIVDEVNNNEPTPCPGQRRQYCNICHAYVPDLKTHVSESHKMTPEERNKLIQNSTDSAKVIQQNHLRPILNDKLLCGICDVKIPKLDLIDHVVSSAHKNKYTEVLYRHNINEIDSDTYYCIPCDNCVAVTRLTRHLSSRRHRRMLITQHFDMDQVRPLHPIQEQSTENESEKEEIQATPKPPVEESEAENIDVLAPIKEEPEVETEGDLVKVLMPGHVENAKTAETPIKEAPPMERQAEKGEVSAATQPQPIESAAKTAKVRNETVEKAEVPAPILELNKLIGLKMYDCNAAPVDPTAKPGEDPICEECNSKIKNCDYAAHLYSIDHMTNHSCYLRLHHCVEINFQTVNCLACNDIFEIRYLVSHCNSRDHLEKLQLQIDCVQSVLDNDKMREAASQTEAGSSKEVPIVTANPVAQPSTSRKGHEFIPKKLFYQFYEVRRTDGLKCMICYGGVPVPCNKIDVINHINTDNHRNNYDALMSFNRIRRLDHRHCYYCDLCAIPVAYFKELSHIHCSKHMELVTPLFDKDIPRSDAELTFEFAMQQQIKKHKKQALFLRHP